MLICGEWRANEETGKQRHVAVTSHTAWGACAVRTNVAAFAGFPVRRARAEPVSPGRPQRFPLKCSNGGERFTAVHSVCGAELCDPPGARGHPAGR